MTYEITVHETETVNKPEFNKETSTIREVAIETKKIMFHIRIEGYKPELLKQLIAFATEKL